MSSDIRQNSNIAFLVIHCGRRVIRRVSLLFKVANARYIDDGHTQLVRIEGELGRLVGKIYHDDRKPLGHWIQAQDRYAILEAKHLSEVQKSEGGGQNERLKFQDRLRLKIFFAAPAMFLYLLFGRGLILDGWPGWYYVMQRTIAEMLLSLRLLTEREGLEEAVADNRPPTTDKKN